MLSAVVGGSFPAVSVAADGADWLSEYFKSIVSPES